VCLVPRVAMSSTSDRCERERASERMSDHHARDTNFLEISRSLGACLGAGFARNSCCGVLFVDSTV